MVGLPSGAFLRLHVRGHIGSCSFRPMSTRGLNVVVLSGPVGGSHRFAEENWPDHQEGVRAVGLLSERLLH